MQKVRMSSTRVQVLFRSGNDVLLMTGDENAPYVIALGWDPETLEWDAAFYFSNLNEALKHWHRYTSEGE